MMKLKFHEKIKILRKINDMTQENLAHELGMSVNSYAQLERGETKSVSNDRLEQILNLFQINFLDFLSLGESGKLCLIHYNQGDDNNNHNEVTIIGGIDTDDLIARLKKEINHKDELLAIKNDMLTQKDNQIAVLENLVAVLQDKTTKS